MGVDVDQADRAVAAERLQDREVMEWSPPTDSGHHAGVRDAA